MDLMAHYLWLIPLLPLVASGLTALMKQRQRTASAALAIGAMVAAFVLSCVAFGATLAHDQSSGSFRAVSNFPWFDLGQTSVQLGWLLDPLSAAMLLMITFVGALIFIYSVGYMAHDENFTRFFCFLSLFAAAMLGLVIANSLLLLFICWELVGLASYLLIGFWYQKPSAAAAAKKAFIVTRIGDMGLFLGMLWLYAQTGTLLFYDNGNGCLEGPALTRLVTVATAGGLAVSTCIALLIFSGAMGKSGQVPLHVWLPDAMEGPTPVSALIHAATMVAAGVFLVARVYPLMDVDPRSVAGYSTALTVVTWLGAITAVFAALIAVAQTDIKRILAYSTVSQLGYMMMGLGVGGVAVGMFHLITHAFFKALLFLGAGSVIHGCHGEQDIRFMGGLKKFMPFTFATYALGMMALSGVPVFFSGFWSKDEILHSALEWSVSRLPFYLGLAGALLTAFYMTRQVCYVFFGTTRRPASRSAEIPSTSSGQALLGQAWVSHRAASSNSADGIAPEPAPISGGAAESHAPNLEPHESPRVMTVPLMILAICTVLLGFIGTPLWPWFRHYVGGHSLSHDTTGASTMGIVLVMLVSTVIVMAGIGLGWWWYGRRARDPARDPLEAMQPDIFRLLREKFYVDELYRMSVIPLLAWCARAADWLDRFVWNGLVAAASHLVLGLSWANRFIDEFLVNPGFDRACGSVQYSARLLAFFQNGQVQRYLRMLALSLSILAVIFIWGCAQ